MSLDFEIQCTKKCLCFHFLAIIANQTKLNEANDNWSLWAPWTLHYPESRIDATKKLRQFYFGDAKEINATTFHQAFTNIFGDRLFIVRGAVAARLESRHTPTYFYYYDYSGFYNTGELVANAQGDFLPNWLNIGVYMFRQLLFQFLDIVPKRKNNSKLNRFVLCKSI